jgi:hypothetical protein
LVAGVLAAGCGSGSGTPRDGGAGTGGTLAGTGGMGTGGATGGVGGANGSGGAGGGAAGTGDPVLTIGLWELSIGATTGLAPTFEINNHDSRTLPMSDMEIRYWFTSDLGGASGVTQSTGCANTNQISCNTITLSLVAVSPARPMADTYLSVTFSPGVTAVPAGGYADFETTISRSDAGFYDQSNDYSYNAATYYTDTIKTTVYYKGALIYGTEP